MAKIAEIAGVNSDQSRFNVSGCPDHRGFVGSCGLKNTATSYLSQWVSNAVASRNSYIDFYYDDSSSDGLLYNLYADKLLQLNMVPDPVYQAATTFYSSIASSNTYGIVLDSDDSQRTSISKCSRKQGC